MEVYSNEALKYMSKDDLKDHYIKVRAEINKSKRIKKDSKDLEMYFCYIIREIESRAFVQQNEK